MEGPMEDDVIGSMDEDGIDPSIENAKNRKLKKIQMTNTTPTMTTRLRIFPREETAISASIKSSRHGYAR